MKNEFMLSLLTTSLFISAGSLVIIRWLHPATFNVGVLSGLLAAAFASVAWLIYRTKSV